MQFYDFSVTTKSGDQVSMDTYRGKVVLVVNTASFCGFTPQFTELQQLFEKYQEQGLNVLGFPCNQFKQQDPKSNDEISQFCQLNYGVTFPMYAKVDVNGDNASPLFSYIKGQAPGVFGSQKIKWNFTKFLIGRDGKVLKRYAPLTKPSAIEKDILKALAK